MKNIAVVFLLIACSSSLAQSLESETVDFIQQKKLILKNSDEYSVKAIRGTDSLISFYSDSLLFTFSIQDISKVKSKDPRKESRNKKELDKIRVNYNRGIDSIRIDEMSWMLESLMWSDLLSAGKVKKIVVKNSSIQSYTCKAYSTSAKNKPNVWFFYTRDAALWGYSTVLCWGINFREKKNGVD